MGLVKIVFHFISGIHQKRFVINDDYYLIVLFIYIGKVYGTKDIKKKKKESNIRK